MASEFADQLSRNLTHGLTEKELAWGAKRIDDALAPVRECLELLVHPKFTTDDDGNIRYYVTRSDVEEARQLYKRLRVELTHRHTGGEKS